MKNLYLDILNNLECFILVTDIDNNIIYHNNDFVYKISKIKVCDDLVVFNNRFFELKQKKLPYNLTLTIYTEITKHKAKIDTLQKDFLTGLDNRHGLVEKLGALDSNYCLIIGDIDFFKNINDKHGHLVGDEVLKSISNVFIKHLRKQDLIGRFGGEEFIIVCPNTNIKGCYSMINRIRKIISKTKFIVNNKNIKLTMTFGITESFEGKSINKLIQEADDALYIGKNSGRNKVVVHKKDQTIV